jgi:hypothetical protein
MIKRFSQFIYESKYDTLSALYANDVFNFIKKTAGSSINRAKTKIFEYDEPIEFRLTAKLIRVVEFDPSKTVDFSGLPWETINFEENGFVLDANAYIPGESEPDSPEIDLVIYISPDAEPSNYQALKFKMVDTIRHELEHLLQKGVNKQTGHIVRTTKKTRERAQDNYKYFLLPDEIPAMVAGMHASAVKKRVPIDSEFAAYLQPFVSSGVISNSEFEEVMKTWIRFTKKSFPASIFSTKYQ